MNIKVLKHRDFKEVFKDSTYDYGIETLNLSSCKDFEKVEEIFNESKKRYIWRGQRKDWQLKSTFDRHPFYNRLTLLDKSGEIREKILETLFNDFKNKLIELEKENPRYNIIKIVSSNSVKHPEYYIWATAQHYGLPTPILDWTEELYVAAYFAFYKDVRNEQCNRIIYALNIKTLKRLKKGEESFVDFLDLNEDYFDYELKERIEGQKSKFTKALNGTDIEENIMKLVRKKPEIREEEENILTKIFIPDKFRCECLDYLKYKEGKTHIKLFPDYYGTVEICKIDFGLDI